MNIPFKVMELAEWRDTAEQRLSAVEAATGNGATLQSATNLNDLQDGLVSIEELRQRLGDVEALLRELPWVQPVSELQDRVALLEQGGGGNPLEAVDFASDQAAELAADAGLTAEDFAGTAPSGANSAFNIADVRNIVAAKTGA